MRQPWLLAGLHVRLLQKHGGPKCDNFLAAAKQLLQSGFTPESKLGAPAASDSIVFGAAALSEVLLPARTVLGLQARSIVCANEHCR